LWQGEEEGNNLKVTNMSGNIKTSFSNLKWWQATIMIVLILTASGFAAWGGANVSVNVQLQAQVDQLQADVEGIQDNLSVSWNPTFYSTQTPYDYVISHQFLDR